MGFLTLTAQICLKRHRSERHACHQKKRESHQNTSAINNFTYKQNDTRAAVTKQKEEFRNVMMATVHWNTVFSPSLLCKEVRGRLWNQWGFRVVLDGPRHDLTELYWCCQIWDRNLNQDQIYYIFALFHPLLMVSSLPSPAWMWRIWSVRERFFNKFHLKITKPVGFRLGTRASD